MLVLAAPAATMQLPLKGTLGSKSMNPLRVPHQAAPVARPAPRSRGMPSCLAMAKPVVNAAVATEPTVINDKVS